MAGRNAGIATAFTAMGILGLAALNFLFSPGYIWFYYAAFAALWWPLSAWFIPRRNHVGFALAGSALTLAFLAVVNLQNSPDHLWFLYACYPFLWWPVVMALGRKAGTLSFAVLCSAVTVAYYAALNLLLSPGYPWAIYPAFAVAWWPLSMYFAKKRNWMGYSFAAALMMIIFFIAVNHVSSPGVNWAVYPIFAVLWWPMAVLAARRKSWLGFSVAGAILVSSFFALVNNITSPGVPWAVFPIFAVLWWPLSVYFFKYKKMRMS